MTWQDWVISIGNWIFFISLIPSITSKDKPALSTSLLTGAVLMVFAFTFSTLGFWLAAASSGLTAIAWLTLAAQKYFKK